MFIYDKKHVYDNEWELYYLHRYRSSNGSDTTSQNRGPTYSSDSSTVILRWLSLFQKPT